MSDKEKCECQKMCQLAWDFSDADKRVGYGKGSVLCHTLHAVFDGFAGLHLMHSNDKGECLCPKCGKVLCRGCHSKTRYPVGME